MFEGDYEILTEKRMKAINKYIKTDFFKDKKLLELGCGYGDNGHEFYKLGCNVTSTDARIEHIKNGKKKYSHIDFKIIDADKDKINKKYDIILHWGLLCHIQEIKTHLKNVCENCNILLLETEVSDSDNESFYIETTEDGYDKAYNNYGTRPSPNYVEKILKDNGFKSLVIKDSILNCGIHEYDWDITNKQDWRFGKTRFWICWNINIDQKQLLNEPFCIPIRNVGFFGSCQLYLCSDFFLNPQVKFINDIKVSFSYPFYEYCDFVGKKGARYRGILDYSIFDDLDILVLENNSVPSHNQASSERIINYLKNKNVKIIKTFLLKFPIFPLNWNGIGDNIRDFDNWTGLKNIDYKERFKRCIESMRKSNIESDISIELTNFVEENFNKQYLFKHSLHPKNRLLYELWKYILQHLNINIQDCKYIFPRRKEIIRDVSHNPYTTKMIKDLHIEYKKHVVISDEFYNKRYKERCQLVKNVKEEEEQEKIRLEKYGLVYGQKCINPNCNFLANTSKSYLNNKNLPCQKKFIGLCCQLCNSKDDSQHGPQCTSKPSHVIVRAKNGKGVWMKRKY